MLSRQAEVVTCLSIVLNENYVLNNLINQKNLEVFSSWAVVLGLIMPTRAVINTWQHQRRFAVEYSIYIY